eukprot:5786644-Prymnesium_polylepis.1
MVTGWEAAVVAAAAHMAVKGAGDQGARQSGRAAVRARGGRLVRWCGAVRCGAVRCGAVRCGAV